MTGTWPLSEPTPVTDRLDEAFRHVDFAGCQVFVLLGHPRSDIGKGQLVARLAALAPGPATVVKFDGILNTNERGNHPSPNDDLATYRRFLPGTVMGWPNQILGGDVLLSFLREFGGTDWEHLSFVPHLSRFFLLTLHRAWVDAGRPDHLFVELGGTVFDQELTTYALPALSMLGTSANARVTTALLSELPGGFVEPKTRSLQDCLTGSLRFGLLYDVLFLRVPERDPGDDELAALEAAVAAKLRRHLVHRPTPPRLVVVPTFEGPALDGYLDYLHRRRHLVADLGRPAAGVTITGGSGRRSEETREGTVPCAG
ncbi:hypothetical protein [Micromonospora sp. DT227]|uniref:hypothetical protein n=1 Tax=Micromonospora sp. DT227 TaxID=3393433 RepID=UPI003CF88D88